MLSRERPFESGLPLIDRLAERLPFFVNESGEDASPWGRGLVVIGPTRQELERHAPSLLRILERAPQDGEYFPSLHLPVVEPKDFASAIEAVWNGDVRGGVVIALPEDLDLKKGTPPGQKHFPKKLIDAVPPSLAAASLLLIQLPRLVLLDESHLKESRFRPGLELLCRKAWEWERLTGKRRLDVFFGAADASSSPMQTPKQDHWDVESRGLLPSMVWSVPAEGDLDNKRVGISLVFSRGPFNSIRTDAEASNFPEGVHLRRLASTVVNELLADDNSLDRLIAIARGERERTDDDDFVPWYELLNNATWSPDSNEVRGSRGLARSKGYPLRRVDDLCTSIEPCKEWKLGMREPGAVYFTDHGLRALPADMVAPLQPKAPEAGAGNLAQQIYADSVTAYERTAIYVLRGCEDAEYLARALSDDVVRLDLRCRSMGSFNVPRISRQALGETLVAWPDPETRRRQLSLLFGLEAEIEGKETQSLLESLEGAVEQLRGTIESQWCDSPYDVERCYAELQREKDLGRKALDAISQLNGGQKPQGLPPAPVAIVDRRVASAEPQLQIALLLKDLPEVLLRYDTTLLLAALGALSADGPARVFAKLAGSKGRWQFSLGNWCQLNRHARKLLSDVTAGSEGSELKPLVQALLSCNASELDQKLTSLISLRNRSYGHGFTERYPDAILKQCSSIWAGLRPQLQYIDRFPLVYVESRAVRRDAVEVKLRMLVHDNSEFAVSIHRAPRNSSLERTCDGEVYVVVNEPGPLLSMYPWIVYGAGSGTAEHTVWMMDSIEQAQVVYKSPFAPGQEWRTPTTRDVIRSTTRI